MRTKLLALWIVLAVLPLDVPGAWAWSARKPAAPVKGSPKPVPSRAPRLRVHSGAQPPARRDNADVASARPDPLDLRVDAALAAKKPDQRVLLRLLREAVAGRETDLAARLAQPLLADPKVGLALLVDAAQVVGSESGLALRMWQRAWALGARRLQLGGVIAQGLADALLAAGDPQGAHQVVTEALGRMGKGLRRGLYDRMAAIARLQGRVPEVADQLVDLDDADALVVAAGLQGEAGDDDRALETLQRAWRRYPGHRALQAALMQLLVRMGHRPELRTVVDQVVRLAPADPMPYLALLDAHIAARDAIAGRALIDELAGRYRRHDTLLEALVDREQRIGQEGARIRALYEQLLAAAPHEPQYIEAFAEWLLGRGRDKEAYLVLAKLGQDPRKWQGLFKQAELLLGHRLAKPAATVVARLVELAPADPKVIKLQAQLAELQEQFAIALRHWSVLAQLGPEPTASDRKRAADARHALVALLRRTHELEPRRATLQATLLAGTPDLAAGLLYFDLVGQLDSEPASDTAAWLAVTKLMTDKFSGDAEVLAAAMAGYLQRDQTEAALAMGGRLQASDADVAEPLLQQLLEGALARQQPALATRAEALLARPVRGVVGQSVLLRLGDLHLRYGDADGAAELYRRAAAGRSDNRAAVRLAALFRQIGQPAAEEAALREVVQRGSDSDELEAAGQRLVTVATVRGKCGDLVRWLDAIAPQHPRKDAVARLRSAAYDAYLRGGTVDERTAGPAPAPGPLGEALSSADLALQIRALRQMAAARRLLPAAAARQLGLSANPAVRRDVALALGAAGGTAAAELLRDIMIEGTDNDDDVRTAQLLALANLPNVPGIDPLLDRGMTRGGDALALLVVGIHGSPALASLLVARREGGSAATLLATGALLGRGESGPELQEVRTTLLDAVARIGSGNNDLPRAAATLWALRASNHARTAQELARVAVQTDNAALRRVALNLLGSKQAPQLLLDLPPVGRTEMLREIKVSAERAVLAPWIQAVPELVRIAATLHGPLLAALWQAQGTDADAHSRRAAWCDQLQAIDSQAATLLQCDPAAIQK